MAAKLCLRCDWTGRTRSDTCPRCGALLFDRAGGEPAPPRERSWRGWVATGLVVLIAAVVFVFSLLLLWGARYSGPHGVPSSLALGGLSGALLGATGIGGPPVILYLLSGPDPVHVTRANLTLYVVFISIAGLVMLAGRGLLDGPGMLTALLLAPMFFGGVIAGSWIFKRVSERRFRQVTLVLLVAVSIGIVLA